MGSRVYMMRLGYRVPQNGICLSGYTLSEPYLDSHWSEDAKVSTALYVEFYIDAMLNIEVQPLLYPATVSATHNWHPQSSGTQIPHSIASHLEIAWQAHLESPKVFASNSYNEGQKSRITVNRYERDPRARGECIAHYGVSCQVCGFNFEAVYGDLGYGYIHVHHLNSLAEQQREHEVDPITDMRPVCPNCHAMLHRETPPLEIEQLQQIIQKHK